MISYSIEIFDKCSEELIKEIKIPNYQLDLVIEIMGFDTIEKEFFIKGVGVSMLQRNRLSNWNPY